MVGDMYTSTHQAPFRQGSPVGSLAAMLEPEVPRGGSSLMVVGHLPQGSLSALSAAAVEAKLALLPVDGADEAMAFMGGRPPRGVILDIDHPDAARVCGALRSDPLNANVPIIGVAREILDRTFDEALRWGANDVVDPSHVGRLGPLLRSLFGIPGALAARGRGRAIIAHPDETQRLLVASILVTSGYEIRMAGTTGELEALLATGPAALVVADLGLGPRSVVDLLLEVRAQSEPMPWILGMPRGRFGETRALVGVAPFVSFHDTATPPDCILFLTNELQFGNTGDLRKTPRLLFGTCVGMRGRDHEAVGFSFNVGEGGIFVRTLAPIPIGTKVSLDLLAPGTATAVTLVARVAWHRPFGPLSGAISPAGLGFQITGGSGWETYRAACVELAKEVEGAEPPPPPPLRWTIPA